MFHRFLLAAIPGPCKVYVQNGYGSPHPPENIFWPELIENAAFGGDSAAGAQMYARLYWAYASLEGDDVDIFTDSMANWPRMSEGFDLMLKQYPDSDYLMSGYGYMACRAGDSEKYHALNAKLRDRLSSTAWSARYSPEECAKKFARNGV